MSSVQSKKFLEVDEFIENLHKLWPEMRINRHQLLLPSYIFLADYLEKFFKTININVEEEMSKTKLDRDIYSGNLISARVYCKMLKKLFCEVQQSFVDTITISNILSPTVKFSNQLLHLTYCYVVFYLKAQQKMEGSDEEYETMFKYQEESKEMEKAIIEEGNQLAVAKTESEVKIKELREECATIEVELEKINEELIKAEKDNEILQAELTDLNKEFKILEEKKNDLETKINAVNDYSELKEELENIKEEINKLNEECEWYKKTLKSKTTHEAELSELVEESDLYPQIVNTLMEHCQQREQEEIDLKKLSGEIQDKKTAQDYTARRTIEMEKEIVELDKEFSKIELPQLDDQIAKKNKLIDKLNKARKAGNVVGEKFVKQRKVLDQVNEKIKMVECEHKRFEDELKRGFDMVTKHLVERTLWLQEASDKRYNTYEKINRKRS